MTDIDFERVLRHQRACRSYSSEPLDDATITALLEAATHAPSAENRQPWVFVVVRDPDRRSAIWSLAERAWVGGGSKMSEGTIPPKMHAEVERGITEGFAGAPVSVVVGADTRRGHASTIGSSVFPAVQNLLLAASARGLGSALTTIATVFADELAAIVELPDTIVPVAVIPIGHPALPLGPPRREPVSDHAHRETFGHPFP